MINTVFDMEKWQVRKWVKEERYYLAEITQTLFGEWILRQSWGSRQSQRGNSRTLPAQNYAHALKLLAQTSNRRAIRGYQLIPTL